MIMKIDIKTLFGIKYLIHNKNNLGEELTDQCLSASLPQTMVKPGYVKDCILEVACCYRLHAHQNACNTVFLTCVYRFHWLTVVLSLTTLTECI